MKINFNQNWYENACHEQEMRAPHMMTKFVDNDARKAGQLRGLIIEHHVSGWFNQSYHSFYLNPDNFEQWTKICSHDFKLRTPSRVLNIDVSGPKKDGSMGSYDLKPKYGVDFHILARPIGFVSWDNIDYKLGFNVLGVLEAKDYKPTIDNSKLITIENWIKKIGL